ncbi:MAG: hypothetical protein WCO06_01095 [Candidatus Roizmanbacteria bacterium]
MIQNIQDFGNSAKEKTIQLSKQPQSLVEQHPLISFFVALGTLLLLIIISNIVQRPASPIAPPVAPAKNVTLYTIGTAPKLSVQAQIEKSGVITITALMPGVIQKLNVKEGSTVVRGTQLVAMASNYQGGNQLLLARKSAEASLKNIEEIQPINKDTNNKNREIISKQETTENELRDITNKTLDDTRSLISLNDELLKSIDDSINQLTATNSGSVNNKDINTYKTQKSSLLGGTNQLRSQLRTTEYTNNKDKSSAQISQVQREIAYNNLNISDKMLDLQLETARLTVQIQRVAEAQMYPSAPFKATVQRVFVKEGQAIQAGTPLVVLAQSAEDDPTIAIAYVSGEIARKISRLEYSQVFIGNTKLSLMPSFITSDAIQGTLYGVYFDIPDTVASNVPEKGFIRIDLPIGYVDSGSAVPFLPLDSIYQTQDQAYVFVEQKGKAESRTIVLGDVYGRFVEIKSGIQNGDRVIIERNVVAGDRVNVE